MKAPAAASHSFPLNKPSPGTHDTSAAATGGGGGGDIRPHLSRPPPSSTTDRGSSRGSPVVVTPHNRADRPVKSAGPQQQQAVGVPPAPSSTSNATGTSRGGERRELSGPCVSPSAARPGGIRPLPAAQHVAGVQAPLVITTRVLTRGDRPMVPVNVHPTATAHASSSSSPPSSRAGSPRPRSSQALGGEPEQHSARSNLFQASDSFRECREQHSVRKAEKKPPRPPGPPPPHILQEQRKRREMAALQRAQQSASSSAAPGSIRGVAGTAAPGSPQALQSSPASASGSRPSSRETSATTVAVAVGVVKTAETTTPPALCPEWQEFWDEEVEASYYYNCTTREAQWVRPDGF